MSFIKINISNSFNRGTNNDDLGETIEDGSTLNKNFGNNFEINSTNVTSLTNSAVNYQPGFTIGDIKRKTLIREIFVGAVGSVVGSIITLVIMNFLR